MNKVSYLNDILISRAGSELEAGDVFCSDGLRIHLINHHHENCLDYLDKLDEIIRHPDYVGVNPNEPNSIELVKVYEENIQVAIKLSTTGNYLYVSTIFDITTSKLERRIESGRLKNV